MKNHTKKFTSLILIAVMTLALMSQVYAASHPFSDVPADAYYADAVEWAYTGGMVNGVSPTSFDPNSPMTRAMIVTILYRASGSPREYSVSRFTDVPSDVWYSYAISWAAENGVVNGTAPDQFSPNDSITREDIVVILWRYAGSPAADGSVEFSDEASVAGYAREAVLWASKNGIVGGKPGNLFDPKGLATRAEVTTVLYRFFGSEYVPEHTHNYIIFAADAAGCTTPGTRTYRCSCGISYTESTPPRGHTYNTLVIAPTATEQGYTLHTCSYCFDAYKDTYVPATGSSTTAHKHEYRASVTKNATCTTTGVKTYVCSCGDSYTESIPTVAHNYVQAWKTVHHEAEYGTRDITETWERRKSYNLFADGYKVYIGTSIWKKGDNSTFQWEEKRDGALVSRETGEACESHGSYSGYIEVVETWEKIVGTEKYLIKNAYDETVPNGYDCSVCGHHKS